MDYERIEKPFSQGGGFSPRKLRAILLGVEKKRQEEEEEEIDSRFSLQLEQGGSSADEFKDVKMVSSVQGCSTSVKNNNGAAISRARSLEEDPLGFEFQKARSALMSGFSKPAPSKWDDAQKWIASPNSSRVGKGKKNVQQIVKKVVMEVVEDAKSKGIDQGEIKREIEVEKEPSWVTEAYQKGDSSAKTAVILESSVATSSTVQSATAFVTPPSTVRSVSMRDMGTEMTPIASQEPSRTGTPLRASTPIRSPSSSRPSTPQRSAPSSLPSASTNFLGDKENELSEKELQMKTRREIMMLGAQLGKTNIAAWAGKEDEDNDASTSFQTVRAESRGMSVIQSRATAWEEAEKTKYLARFKEEEIKIQAWENHQKAKSEAEMRKIEVEVERMKAQAHEKLMSKLASMRQKAEEKRATAEAKRNQQASRTAEQVDYIKRTGHIPSSFFCWSRCF